MAQETPNPTEGAQQTEARGRDNQIHYYSGGEVKELSHSRVSPVYWGMVTLVIIGAIFYFIVGGALGPKSHFGGFEPEGGSQANLNTLQTTLVKEHGANGYEAVDLNNLPIPQGQTITQAINNGSQVYQSYCIGCHGPNQDGNGVGAATLNPKPRNLRDAPFMQSMSYQRINTSLHKGVPGTAMPRWENLLTQDEISEVIAYVFSLTSPPPTVTSQGTQADGTKAYVNGSQNSPKPITPAIGGNPTAPTNTAPPSMSGATVPATGPTPEQGRNMTNPNNNTAPGLGSENNAPRQPSMPTSGGQSAKPLLAPAGPKPPTHGPVKPGNQQMATSPAAPAPKPAAPTPGTSASPTTSPTGAAGGTATRP